MAIPPPGMDIQFNLDDLIRQRPPSAFARIMRDQRCRKLDYLEWCIRECLGFWVSELEPSVVMDHESGNFLGLTADGHSKVYVPYPPPR